MTSYRKLLEKVRNNPKNVTFQELERLMNGAGFSCNPGKGDHYRFTHPKLNHPIIVDSRGKRKDLAPIYVKRCIEYIEYLDNLR